MLRALDRLFLLFFLVHIPITLLIDIQGPVVPREYYPEALQQLSKWYAVEFQDFLMEHPPVWFRSFVFAELVFQFPLLLISIYGLWTGKSWSRFSCLVYGVHVTSSLLPIMAEFWAFELAFEVKLTLSAIYAPYIIVPGLMSIRFACFEYPLPGCGKSKLD